MRKVGAVLGGILLLAASSWAQLRPPKPGWNLFSVEQDMQLGKEASAQVDQKMAVVHNQELQNYLDTILRKLEQTPHGKYFGNTQQPIPYTIHAVADKNINAFSLPGGPLFVNTGLIRAADNEAQLAGVIGHEMSHVVLRHATNQASKQNLISLPAMLAGAMMGHGIFGQLARLGIGLGANSVLLRFSRTDESEADYNGALIAAEAGYNPLEMAHFFEKLEAQSGRAGAVAQFLSDHPNPGNRVRAVENEIRLMPQRNFTTDETGQFTRIKDLVSHLAAPGQLNGVYGHDAHAPEPPSARPSSRLKEFRGQGYTLSYPENWQVFGDRQGNSVTIAPREGLVQNAGGSVAVGYGIEVSYYFPQDNQVDLNRDTQALIQQLQQANPGMRVSRPSRPFDGQRGLISTLTSSSPFRGEQEIDTIITVTRPEGLFYVALIAPQSEAAAVESTFEAVLRSIRFTNQ